MTSNYYFNQEDPSWFDKFIMSRISLTISTWLLRISTIILALTAGFRIGVMLEQHANQENMKNIMVISKDNQILEGEWIKDKNVYQLKK